tara:strand:+ start:55 stop:420 length:366 start_codon:yes stop_codon:yes gene_type:complete
MNELLAGIYETGGFQKTAGVNGQDPMSLSDLALMISVEQNEEGADLEKVASVQDSVLDELVSFDRAGRAMAHAEFSEMEKAASEGNMEPLEIFFTDVEQEDVSEREQLKAAVLEELARRNA